MAFIPSDKAASSSKTRTKFDPLSAEHVLARIKEIHTQFQLVNPENLNPSELKVLHRLVHNLVGVAGTFGFFVLSTTAQHLESLLFNMLQSEESSSSASWLEISNLQSQLEKLALISLKSNAPNLIQPFFQPPAEGSPLIYIVDDDQIQAYQIGIVLEDNGYRVRYFTELNKFVAAWSSGERADAVIMDLIFPEGEMAGAAVLMELKDQLKILPPIIIISVRDDFEARIASVRAGASYYLSKPVDPLHLMRLLDPLTIRLPVKPYRVLMLDDDTLLLEINAEVLRQAGLDVYVTTDPQQAYNMMLEFLPDVVVLDMYMPDISGVEFAAVLRAIEPFFNIPILFLSGEQNFDKQVMALKFGGDVVLKKPVQPEHLTSLVISRAQRMRQQNSVMDFLQRTLYEREREHLAIDYHAIVSIGDQTGSIIYVNDKFCIVSGYGRDELLGQNHRIVKSDVHSHDFFQNMWRILTSGNVWQGILCNRNKEGNFYWVDTTIVPFLDSRGNPYQYVAIHTDITQLKLSGDNKSQHVN